MLTTTIVNITAEINVFHYNKLAYLFEYFYIKNFASRYSDKKSFYKLPHGPVIKGYKTQITKLAKTNIFYVDLDALNKNRKLEDDLEYEKILIKPNNIKNEDMIQNTMQKSLLQEIIRKFAHLSTDELEEFVYRTEPMIKFKEQVERGYKKDPGGYILDNCITLKNYTNPKTVGRKLAMEHLKKYPKIDLETQKTAIEEMAYLESLRPHF